jgi:hypothetical protein
MDGKVIGNNNKKNVRKRRKQILRKHVILREGKNNENENENEVEFLNEIFSHDVLPDHNQVIDLVNDQPISSSSFSKAAETLSSSSAIDLNKLQEQYNRISNELVKTGTKFRKQFKKVKDISINNRAEICEKDEVIKIKNAIINQKDQEVIYLKQKIKNMQDDKKLELLRSRLLKLNEVKTKKKELIGDINTIFGGDYVDNNNDNDDNDSDNNHQISRNNMYVSEDSDAEEENLEEYGILKSSDDEIGTYNNHSNQNSNNNSLRERNKIKNNKRKNKYFVNSNRKRKGLLYANII